MKILSVSGRAFYLPGDNIDTDRIIPARYLRCVTFDGLGEHVFEDDRQQLNGTHPFDNPENKGFNVLVVDENFGSGSSREHAPVALQKWGIQAIIGKSFAAIFRGNATANGMTCVEVSERDHRSILRSIDWEGGKSLIIDLVAMTIANALINVKCQMPSADRDMLTTGNWDTTVTLLEAGDKIEAVASRLPYAQKF